MTKTSKDLLSAVLTPGNVDLVSADTDETFEKAIELPADRFGELFERRANSHIGFSGSLTKRSSE